MRSGPGDSPSVAATIPVSSSQGSSTSQPAAERLLEPAEHREAA
jgi:hypothetical protein